MNCRLRTYKVQNKIQVCDDCMAGDMGSNNIRIPEDDRRSGKCHIESSMETDGAKQGWVIY